MEVFFIWLRRKAQNTPKTDLGVQKKTQYIEGQHHRGGGGYLKSWNQDGLWGLSGLSEPSDLYPISTQMSGLNQSKFFGQRVTE